MKKLSILMAALLCVLTASATNYVGRMVVQGETGQAVKDDALVTMQKNPNGTYKAILNDFIIFYQGKSYNLGTLEYDNLTGVPQSDGYIKVTGTSYIGVKDIEGYESLIPEQYQSYLDYVRNDKFPVNFNGKFNDNDMTAHIDTRIVVKAEPYSGYVMTYMDTPMNIDYTGNAVAIKGDVDNNGYVDIDDINIIINIILHRDDPAKYGNRAYVVGSTAVSISDLNAVINITLGKE